MSDMDGGREQDDPSTDEGARDGPGLRERVQEGSRERAAQASESAANLPADAARLLQVHQIEPEKQIQELRRMQAGLAASQVRHADLYELVPVGYLTLSQEGLIQGANLIAATLLGEARDVLIGQPITRFIAQEDQDLYALLQSELLSSQTPRGCELRMQRTDETLWWAHLTANAAQDTYGAPELRLAMDDISDRAVAEGRRARFDGALRERMKELTCLYAVSRDMQADLSTPEVCQRAVEHLISAMHYPEVCAAAIEIDGRLYGSSRYAPGLTLSLRAEIRVADLTLGHVKVCYTEDRAFLVPEEQNLVNAVAEVLGARLLREQAQERAKSAARFPDGNPNPVARIGGGRLLYANPAALELAQSLGSGVGSPAPAEWHTWAAQALAGPCVRSVDAEYAGRTYSVQVVPVPESGYVDFYGSDITQRSEAERSRAQADEALAEEHYLLGLLMDTVPDYIYFKDREGRFVRTNKAHAALVGLTDPAQAVGRTDSDFFPYERAQKALADEQDIMRTGQPLVSIEEHGTWPDGRVQWVSATKMPLYDRDGRVVGTFGISRDITQHKQADEALRSSEAMLRSVLASSPDGITVVDLDGRIALCNQATADLHGFAAPEALVGKSFLELIAGDDRQRAQTGISKVLSAGAMKDVPFTGRRGSDTTYSGELSVNVLRDGSGRPIGFVGVGRDVTERKLAEEEREKLHAQLMQAHKMESVGRLAGGVAHDFNNMLGVILGHAELALQEVDASLPLHDDLLQIQKAGQRSADLTRQLLAFARRQTIAPKVLDLNDTVAEMLRMLQRLIGEDIHLVWQPGGNLWPVKMDASQIDQMLANLCVNARDAIAGVGTVSVETGNVTLDERYCAAHAGAAPGEYVRLAVTDTGCGMGPEVLEHLFEPFFTTKGVGQGTGLGLATVYGAVKQNRGYVEVQSAVGQGSTFTLYLPRHVTAKVAASAATNAGMVVQRGSETVLLVEDNPQLQRLARLMLQGAGYRVLATDSPREALRLAAEAGQIDVLVTDVVMPEMNGRDLAARLLLTHPRMKRVFISGYTRDVLGRQGEMDEGVHFVQKPFAQAALTGAVREALAG